MEKAKRITSVRNSLTEDELRRRLPELAKIEDIEVREATEQAFLKGCPDYFWERPASSSGKYHPPDESEQHGTWLHTKRVFAEYENLSESMVELGQISERQRACGMAAALLHDMLNYGWPSEGRDHTTDEHDVIAAAVANYIGECPEEVVHLIHAHMGPWGSGKLPETEHERLFHLADKSAAKRQHRPGVYDPAVELTDQFPDLKIIEDE